MRATIKQEDPNIESKDIMKELGVRWNTAKLADGIEKWVKMAADDKVRYQEESASESKSESESEVTDVVNELIEKEEQKKKKRKRKAKKAVVVEEEVVEEDEVVRKKR